MHETTCLFFVFPLMNAKVYETAKNRRCSNVRNRQENRNHEETDSLQEGEDGDINNANVEADGRDVDISDEEGEDTDASIVENGGNNGIRMPCIRAGSGGADDSSSLTTNSRTQVTDVDSFWQHETIMGNMPDIKGNNGSCSGSANKNIQEHKIHEQQ